MTVINVKVVNNIAYLCIKYTNIVICCYCMSVRGKKAGCPIRHIALQLLKCCCQMKSFGITTVTVIVVFTNSAECSLNKFRIAQIC